MPDATLAHMMDLLEAPDFNEARNWLAEKGYDRAMGARPMARVIQDSLKKPLANELLFGSLVDGGHQAMEWSEKTRTPHCNTEKCVGCLLCDWRSGEYCRGVRD